MLGKTPESSGSPLKILSPTACRVLPPPSPSPGEWTLNAIADVLVGVVALLHAWFLVLEMFLWTKPLGLRTFRNSPEHARASATLAANQGLYNGFLVAGLVWGLLAPAPEQAFALKTFFLGCVVTAGLFGAATVSKRIFFVQALPALIALGLLFGGR